MMKNKKRKRMANSDLVQSVIKALDILHAVSNSEKGIRLNELSEMFGMKKPTIHNLVKTLKSRDYLTKDSASRFHLGAAVSELMINSQRSQLLQRSEKIFRELAAKYPQTIFTLSELCGTEIFCRLRMSPDQPGLLQHPMTQTLHPYNSATGNCFLAFNSSIYAEVLGKYPFDEYGMTKWRNQEEFESYLAEVREQGWCKKQEPKGQQILIALPIGEKFVLGLHLMEKLSKNKLDNLIKTIISAVSEITG
jgi:DNA-binding IclR family transcriptional regulator